MCNTIQLSQQSSRKDNSYPTLLNTGPNDDSIWNKIIVFSFTVLFRLLLGVTKKNYKTLPKKKKSNIGPLAQTSVPGEPEFKVAVLGTRETNFNVTEYQIFISVFNQLHAQNLFHNKFCFTPLHVSSTCARNM